MRRLTAVTRAWTGLAIALAALGCAVPRDAITTAGERAAGRERVTATVHVTASAERGLPRVPADFLGLSFEAADLTHPRLDPDDTRVRHLLANLGAGTLRFGGNTVERTGWSRSTLPQDPRRTIVTPADLDRVFALAQSVGWRVILGVGLARNDPAPGADAAAYAAANWGESLVAIEIGNEPDRYASADRNLRPVSWGLPDYRAELEAHKNAVARRAPGVVIAGPATCCRPDWLEAVVRDPRTRPGLATHHFYPLWENARDPAHSPTLENLLAPSTMRRVVEIVGPLAEVCREHGVPLSIDETNSVTRGGAIGVSDTFASALWALDYVFTLAGQGVRAANFHVGLGACGTYSPICLRDVEQPARPLYYAMLVSARALPGSVVPVAVRTRANVAAHAILRDDGTLRLVLVNKELGRPVEMNVRIRGAYTEAGVWRLTAPQPTSRDGVRLGGRRVASDGRWEPGPEEGSSVEGGWLTIELAPASAALVECRR